MKILHLIISVIVGLATLSCGQYSVDIKANRHIQVKDPPMSYASSVRHLNNLIKVDSEIYSMLKNNLSKPETKQEELKHLEKFVKNYERVPFEMRVYLGKHPLLTNALIRRYQQIPNNTLIYKEIVGILRRNNLQIPDGIDLDESIGAIIRIADFYDIGIEKIRQGRLKEDDFIMDRVDFEEFDGKLCGDFGEKAIQTGYITQGIEWMEMAIGLSEDFKQTNLLQNILIQAIEKHNAILSNHTMLNLNVYSEPIRTHVNMTTCGEKRCQRLQVDKKRVKRRDLAQFAPLIGEKPDAGFGPRVDAQFKAICNGMDLMPAKDRAKLRCHYEHLGGWGSLKSEVISVDPIVVQMYEVATQADIRHFREDSVPISEGFDRNGGFHLTPGGEYENDRRGYGQRHLEERSQTWILPLLHKVNLFTGFNTLPPYHSTQMGVYSPGGYIFVHEDIDALHIDDEKANLGFCGDRIATFMFYLSDVEVGGYTAFVQGLVASKPVEGSAIFWFNRKKNGRSHPYRWHGGCPVIVGQKWIANKWICYNGQFGKIPCSLNPEE